MKVKERQVWQEIGTSTRQIMKIDGNKLKWANLSSGRCERHWQSVNSFLRWIDKTKASKTHTARRTS